MTSDMARAVKGSSGFLNGSDPCKDPGHSVFPWKWKQGRSDSRKGVGRIKYGWALAMRMIKRNKGIRWMPWHAQAMKDVIRCDKRWGAANKL